jgi:hypothetical protein
MQFWMQLQFREIFAHFVNPEPAAVGSSSYYCFESRLASRNNCARNVPNSSKFSSGSGDDVDFCTANASEVHLERNPGASMLPHNLGQAEISALKCAFRPAHDASRVGQVSGLV